MMDSQYNWASAGGLVVAAQHGHIDVHQWEPRYRLEPFAAEAVAPVSPAAAQPSRLLAASSRIVDFYGRHTELSTLRGWRDAGDAEFSAQLWHGRGGQGKTRLAAEFARQSIRDGWSAVQARQYGVTKAFAVSGPTLLIVDYAERWASADLWALLVDGRWHAAPTRVLLLARSAGSWWEALAFRLERQLEAPAEAHLLGPLARNGPEHATLFRAARDRFAERFGLRAESIDPPSTLEADAQGSVLGVHMAALASVYAHQNGERLDAYPAAVSIDLLRREHEHWQLMHHDARRPTRPEAMARAVYLSLLTRALPYQGAVEALQVAGIASTAETAGHVLDDHAVAYPPTDPATVLEPMYPDRLGEDFYALQTPGHSHSRHQPDAWALGVPIAMADHAPRMLFTLIEVAKRWRHVAHRQLFPLLRDRPDVALRAGGRALSALAELPDLDLSVLDAIDAAHPGANPDLDEALATLNARLVQRLAMRETDPRRLADLQHRLAARLVAVGWFDEAVPPARLAVAHLRRGLTPEPNPRLAEALSTLGRALKGVGEQTEALTCLRSAARILHRVPERTARQDALLAELLMATGDPEAAHPIWRRLAADNAVFLPRLAASHEAIGQWQEAVRAWRGLATTAPRTYEPKLALALTMTGSNRDLTEAVGTYRRMAAFDVTYRPHLVRALARLAKRTRTLSLLDEALAVRLPDRFRLDRARVLHLFAQVSAETGQRVNEALNHVMEAIALLRESGRTPEARRVEATLNKLFAMLRTDNDDSALWRKASARRGPSADCPKCHGTGYLEGSWRKHACDACIGAGMRFRPCLPCGGRGCDLCGGTGLRRGQRCLDCRGMGRDDAGVKCRTCGGTGLVTRPPG